MMKKPNRVFKVPAWFRKLWNGTLFGSRKDKLILRIVKLGGKDLLISQCGLPLEMDTIDTTKAPSIKLLLMVLHEAEAQRRRIDEAAAKGEAILAHPEELVKNYNKKRNVLINRKDLYCEAGIWTPKQPSVKRRK